jgi:shikimate dehydrogenase
VKESYTLADLENWSATAGDVQPPIRLGVFGDPVAHSLSPQLQNAACTSAGLQLQYVRFHIREEELERALRLLPSLNFVGVNLTLPHKVAGAGIVDELDEHARRVGAINTVLVEGERLLGFSTDGPGFSRAIRQEFWVDLRDLRVLVFGAGGGAGRAVAVQCAMEGCERLALVNRTHEKAQELVSELRPFLSDTRVTGPVARIEAVPWDEQALRFAIAHTDLLVNATSVGMRRSDPPLIPAALIAPHLMVYDTVYTRSRTPLLSAAAEAGARVANGTSMLLHQGAISFETWFDRDAPIDAMRSALAAAGA